jgi:hypothetical protein
MKLRFFAFFFLLLLSVKSFCQFSENDITITTTGLSDEYALRFKESSNKAVMINLLNLLRVEHDIVPIKITVFFEKNEGNVIAEINYNHDKIFSGYSAYSSQNSMGNRFGKGISVYLQDQIFTILGEYKKSVATKGYSRDTDILKFASTVKLKKANGDWVAFYAYNYFDSQGFYPFTFYQTVQLSVDGKKNTTDASNYKSLSEMKYFMVGKTTGLDGSKTGAYYFCKFFNIPTE